MRDILKFSQFLLLEAKATVHFRDRFNERTFEKNIDLGLSKSFLNSFQDPDKVELNIKNKILKIMEDQANILLAKTYGHNESWFTMMLDPKIEYDGKIYPTNLKVKSLDKKGNERILFGPYWAVIGDNRIFTMYNREDKGDDMLIHELKQHIKTEFPDTYESTTKFSIDRTTTDPVKIIKISKDGEVIEEIAKYIPVSFKEFQTVIKPGMDITYYGFDTNKNMVKKTSTIESISRLDGKPINLKTESDVTLGVKIFFTNKSSKSFVPNKDVIIIDGYKAEITRIFLDKRQDNPINFMLKVKNVKE